MGLPIWLIAIIPPLKLYWMCMLLLNLAPSSFALMPHGTTPLLPSRNENGDNWKKGGDPLDWRWIVTFTASNVSTSVPSTASINMLIIMKLLMTVEMTQNVCFVWLINFLIASKLLHFLLTVAVYLLLGSLVSSSQTRSMLYAPAYLLTSRNDLLEQLQFSIPLSLYFYRGNWVSHSSHSCEILWLGPHPHYLVERLFSYICTHCCGDC